MNTCYDQRKRSFDGINSKDDVDLESLIQQIDSGNEESSQTDISSSSGGAEALIESNESIASEEEVNHHSSKASFFDKHFLKSLPVAILSRRKLFGSHSDLTSSPSSSPLNPHSLPASRNNDNLLSPRKMDRITSCKIQRNGLKQVLWNVWISDLAIWKEVELPVSSTCALLIHTLLTKLRRNADLTTWSIIEQNSESLTERYVEDHEIMDEVSSTQEHDIISRFCLNKTLTKYSILLNPELCLPSGMLTFPENSPESQNKDTVRKLQMQHLLTKTAPEMCGWLHVREVGKRNYKKLYSVLRNSGLYYCIKNTNKVPHNMVCIAEVHSAQVWFLIKNKKPPHQSPTPFTFCLKPRSFKNGGVIHWFCAESEHLRSAWISCLRLTLNGCRFHESYLSARRHGSSNLVRSSSDRALDRRDGNFVAMDFSGTTGRVITNPQEAAMVEVQQQSSWRRRLFNKTGGNAMGNSAPTRDIQWFARAIHQTQPWYYGKISREEATDEIQRYGNIDGTFLVRDSHSIPGGIVITLCHNQKSRHIPLTQFERDGQFFYSADNGETRFTDLIQFIDFHRLNKSSLPCVLVHECTRRCS